MNAEAVVMTNPYQKSVKDLIDLVLKGAKEKQRKFVESFEVIINCNLGKDETLRGSFLMPNDLGKVLKIAAFIPEDNTAKRDAVLKAGADRVGFQDLISEIESGKIEYDVYMASASSMAGLKKIASILGAKGLMPNAKVGTLTDNIESVAGDMKNKIAFFKSGKTGLVQTRVGTVAMTNEQIFDNLNSFVKHVFAQNKNPSTNKNYIKSIYIKSSMGKVYKIENLSELVG
jgi:large subunit ribosomal protein L1